MPLFKDSKKSLADKNKDILFSKLFTIANMEQFKSWKEYRFQKLRDYYKISLNELEKGNNNFLQKFNELYSARKYETLEDFINLFKKRKSSKSY
jgi:hypothetical protein